MIDEVTKRIIVRVVNVFETGTPDGKYDSLVVYPDGKDGTRQITYGRSQTTEQGNLDDLIMLYIHKGGIYSKELSLYMERLGKQPLVEDRHFKDLLIEAARDDELMRTAQDEFFNMAYYNPAYRFFDQNGFTFPLSMLVIYDSFIHSGTVPQFLRRRFGEYPPINGGNEKRWIYSYVDVRHQWLKYNAKLLLQKTIYRTQCLKDLIVSENWNLDKLPIQANGVAVS